MAEPQVWDATGSTLIGLDVWNVRTILGCDWSGGRLLAFALEDGQYSVWGDGYQRPEGVAVLEANRALITEAGAGTLLLQDLNQPGRAHATVVAGGLGAPHQVTLLDAAALVADHAGGRLLRVDLTTGAVGVLLAGLAQPVGIAAAPDGTVYLAEQGTGSILRLAPDGTRSTLLSPLVAPFFLSWADADRTALLVPERGPANRVGVVRLDAPATIERLVGRSVSNPSHAVLAGDRLLVSAAGRVLALDAAGGLRGGVRVESPGAPLAAGAWADLSVDTGLTGYTRPELKLAVEPQGVASVSEHLTRDADPTRPTIRLLAGGAHGTADVVVRDAASNAELGRTPIEVGPHAAGPDGPPLWIDQGTPPPPATLLSVQRGVNDHAALRPRDGAQNPTGTWRVLAVLVDTGDATWPTAVPPGTAPTVAAAQAAWGTVFSGAAGVDAFFNELSGGRLRVSLVTGGVLGPVSLGKKWGDWFTMPAGSAQWITKPETYKQVVAALQAQGLDWTQVDCLFLLVRSAGGSFVWPRAQSRVWNQKVKSPDGTKDLDVRLSAVAMPHDQTTVPNLGFTDVEVTCHELGHTLGLDDLYMDDVATYTAQMRPRALGTRELMGNQSGLPHLSTRHKLLLGFLDPGHVRPFTYDEDADVTLELVPAAAGLPPAGRFAAVELRVAPKVSWFFEFRQAVPGRLGDGVPFGAGEVVGYDAWTYANPPVVANARRPIILLTDDGDGEGPILVAPEDYDVLDTNNPDRTSSFRLEVVSVAPGLARVRVTVRRVRQPDPSIRNHEGERTDFKSPDLEVRNELTRNGIDFFFGRLEATNVPIVGINEVVAKVRNIGDLPAPGVRVRFKVRPFNTADPDAEGWADLGEPVTHDIPANTTVDFVTEWSPQANVHHCLQARIDRYTRVPGAAADEPDVDNNLAQSNYFQVFSVVKSPASREATDVEVHNPHDRPAYAAVELRQDSDAYRSYVDHSWLLLQPGESRTVRLEVESKATSIWQAIESRYPHGLTWVRAWFDAIPGDTSGSGTGAALGVSTVVSSHLEVAEQAPGAVYVRLSSPAGGPPPGEGTVALQVDYADGSHEVVMAEVDPGGWAGLHPRADEGFGTLSYSGAPGYAPVTGVEVHLEAG